MNSAVLQGTIMASSHGISRLNRHARRTYNVTGIRISNFLQKQDLRNQDNETVELKNDNENVNTYTYNDSENEQAMENIFVDNIDDADYLNTKDIIRLNVGGASFILKRETIRKRKCGRLNSLLKLPHSRRLLFADAYFEESNEYFFERSPMLFHIIYQFYVTGFIHQPHTVCGIDLVSELDYWNIPSDKFITDCCFDKAKNERKEENKINESFKKLLFGRFREKIWKIIEKPSSSKKAQIFAICSVLFVLISISGLVLSSIPEFQIPVKRANETASTKIDMEPHSAFGLIEYVCVSWFTFEYTIKLTVTSNRWKTFIQPLNIIDLLAILPFLIELFLHIIGVNSYMRDLKGVFLVIRILRILRVIRVLKLGRYSNGLQMFARTLKASLKQLCMMAVVVLTGVIFFSTLIYFIEKDEPNSQFQSIPAACWWCIVTMTTVGYGDITPVTVYGKLIATGAIACGVLVLALPITIIVDNFMKVAEEERSFGSSGYYKYDRYGRQFRNDSSYG